MTWAEYAIRVHAYNRIELNEWRKVREMAWSSLVGPHYDPKKLPKTINMFMPLGENRTGNITEIMRDRIKEVRAEYLKVKK